MKKILITPRRYVQGPGVLDELGASVKPFGEKAVILWDKLVKRHPNIFMTINGHVLNDGLGFLTSKGDGGNTVRQMLVNYQMLPVGGGAWLRLLTFAPDDTIKVQDYSPLYEEFNTEPDNHFVIPAG